MTEVIAIYAIAICAVMGLILDIIILSVMLGVLDHLESLDKSRDADKKKTP